MFLVDVLCFLNGAPCARVARARVLTKRHRGAQRAVAVAPAGEGGGGAAAQFHGPRPVRKVSGRLPGCTGHERVVSGSRPLNDEEKEELPVRDKTSSRLTQDQRRTPRSS